MDNNNDSFQDNNNFDNGGPNMDNIDPTGSPQDINPNRISEEPYTFSQNRFSNNSNNNNINYPNRTSNESYGNQLPIPQDTDENENNMNQENFANERISGESYGNYKPDVINNPNENDAYYENNMQNNIGDNNEMPGNNEQNRISDIGRFSDENININDAKNQNNFDNHQENRISDIQNDNNNMNNNINNAGEDYFVNGNEDFNNSNNNSDTFDQPPDNEKQDDIPNSVGPNAAPYRTSNESDKVKLGIIPNSNINNYNLKNNPKQNDFYKTPSKRIKNNNNNNLNNSNTMTYKTTTTDMNNDKSNIGIQQDNRSMKSSEKQSNKEENNSPGCMQKLCGGPILAFAPLILLVIHLLLGWIFFYYQGHKGSCQSEIIPKLSLIVGLYIAFLIVQILMIVFTILMHWKQNENIGKVFGMIALAANIISIVLQVVLIAIVQRYYSKTNSWTDCGNLKGWTITWLIFNYCIIIFAILLTVVGLCQTENDEE